MGTAFHQITGANWTVEAGRLMLATIGVAVPSMFEASVGENTKGYGCTSSASVTNSTT